MSYLGHLTGEIQTMLLLIDTITGFQYNLVYIEFIDF